MSKEMEEINIETPLNSTASEEQVHLEPVPGRHRVMRRNGKVTAYDPHKIVVAMTKAFLSVEGSSAAASSRIHNEVENLTDKVDQTIRRRFPNGGVVHIEDIQDQVELAIMRAGYQDVARAYVIYREDRAKARKLGVAQTDDMPSLQICAHCTFSFTTLINSYCSVVCYFEKWNYSLTFSICALNI